MSRCEDRHANRTVLRAMVVTVTEGDPAATAFRDAALLALVLPDCDGDGQPDPVTIPGP